MKTKSVSLRRVLLSVIVLLLATAPASAERAMTEKARRDEATDVFVGVVSDRYSKRVSFKRNGDENIENRYLLEIAIEEVEKGSLAKGTLGYVRAWDVAVHGRLDAAGLPPIGEGGHSPIPNVGDRVRVFCVRGEYRFMPQSDAGYAAVYPSGFEIVRAKSDK